MIIIEKKKKKICYKIKQEKQETKSILITQKLTKICQGNFIRYTNLLLPEIREILSFK